MQELVLYLSLSLLDEPQLGDMISDSVPKVLDTLLFLFRFHLRKLFPFLFLCLSRLSLLHEQASLFHQYNIELLFFLFLELESIFVIEI